MSVPDQVRGALQALAVDTRCSEADRAAFRALVEHGTEFALLRLRALLR